MVVANCSAVASSSGWAPRPPLADRKGSAKSRSSTVDRGTATESSPLVEDLADLDAVAVRQRDPELVADVGLQVAEAEVR